MTDRSSAGFGAGETCVRTNRPSRVAKPRIAWVALALALIAVAPTRGIATAAPQFSVSILRPPDSEPGDFFGAAITSLGDRLVVGAPANAYEFLPGSDLPGRVYVMDVRGNVSLTIENPTPAAGDRFGAAVAVVGGNVLVGAPNDDTEGQDAGAAYVFDGTTGALLRTLAVPGVGANDQCGRRVADLGGRALVQCHGAYLFDVATGAVLRHFASPGGYETPTFGTLGGDVVLADADTVYRLDATSGAVVATYTDPALPSAFPGEVADLGGNLVVADAFHAAKKIHLFDGVTGTLLWTSVEDAYVGAIESVAAIGDAVVAGEGLAVHRFDAVTGARQGFFFPEEVSKAAPAGTVRTVFGDSYASSGYSPVPNNGRGLVFLFDRCGNAILSEGEQCDDGNVVSGDGCSSTCKLELCPTTAVFSSCRSLTSGSTAKLEIRRRDSGSWGENADKLSWTWKGAATTLADFGDPTATASYQLCIYDDLSNPTLKMSPAVPTGLSCHGGSCWKASGAKGFKYVNKAAVPAGIERIDLRAGGDGQAKLSVKGRGLGLGVPDPVFDGGPLPLGISGSQSVGVLLINSDTGVCWAAGCYFPTQKHGTLKLDCGG